jgi:hypothetical protein
MSTIKIKRTTGSSAPTGLTFGEPAYVQGLKSLYMGQTAGDPAIRIGAEVDTNTSLGSSDNKIPTQLAVKTYVDSAIVAGGGGFTLAASSGTPQTITNGTDTLTIAAGSGISTTAGATDTVTIANTGVTGAVAGTGISVSSQTGNITITNTGVQSFNGSTGAVSFVNYVSSAVAGSNITVSGATGAVTIGVTLTPSFTTISTSGNGTVGGNLTVTGNLTVNGTTTTVNSDTMTVDDPVIILGTSGGVPIAATDGGKDRGIAFNYFADSAGRTGFFGYDASANEFVFLNRATVTNDVAAGLSFGNVRIGADLDFQPTNLSLTDTIRAPGSGNVHTLSSNYGGEIVSSGGTYPTATGRILRSNESLGAPTAPTWIDPSAAGFTAYASTRLATARNIALTGNVTATGVAFDGTAGITLTTVIPSSTVTNAMLVNSGFTLGTTNITLGSTGLTLGGLNSVSATTFTGALSGNASTATALQTARTIGITGDIDGTATSFDGTSNINISAQIAAGSIVNADINASAAIVDTKLATIQTVDKVSIAALNISGASDIGAALADADLIIVDDGGGKVNRKSAVTRIYEYVFSKVSGDITIGSTGVAAIGSGVIVNADINASAAIADTKLDTISTANKVSLTALNIDGGEETTTIAGSDLLIVDDGANGTNRKVTVDNLFGANSTATVDGGSY